MATALLATGAAYTFVVLCISQWLFAVPLSYTIQRGFGEERLAWLLLGVALDLLHRFFVIFDPET